MKFVCMKCESFMSFEKVETPAEQSLGVMFACPTCEAKVAMVTNPGETAMVQALGVKLGGRTEAATPMALTRESLKETPETIESTSASAQQAMLKTETEKSEAEGEGACPFSSMMAQMGGSGMPAGMPGMPSGMPAGMPEMPKADSGCPVSMPGASAAAPSTLSWSPEAEERVEKIPTFMRPMIKMGVESYARKHNIAVITPEVMEESKNDKGDLAWTKEAESRLDNIPAFVRPMAKKEIERMAKERGENEISAELLEEAKGKFMGMGY